MTSPTRRVHTGRIACLMAALLCGSAAASAQVRVAAGAVLDHPFGVDTARGDRAAADFAVVRPGRIRVQAVWTGSARSLALILNGPGRTGYYARRDGESPLVVEFDAREDQTRRGADWKASIVNFGGGTARGHLLVEYPGRPRLVLAPREPAAAAAAAAPSAPVAPDTSPAVAAHRTILEDGTVETRLPDGTIRQQKLGDCGYTIIRPDGSEAHISCVQVPREAVPDLPADLIARTDLGTVLDAVAENLLDDIRTAVTDEAAVNHYLTLESGRSLQDRIFLRLEALSLLTR